MRGFLLTLALLVTGCGDDPPAARAPRPAAPPPSPAVEPPAPVTAPEARREREPRAERRPAADRDRVREQRRVLRDARRAHQAGRNEEALRAYRRAVELDPTGRALCELGWVQFRTGDRDGARSSIERGLTMLPTRDPVPADFVGPVGACLYNHGRVLEDAGLTDAARAAYQRSLAVRDNRVVRERLASLPTPAAPNDPAAGFRCAAGGRRVIDLDAWERRVRALTERARAEARDERSEPDDYDELLAEVGLGPTDDALASMDEYGDAYVPPGDDAPGTTASVARMPIDLGDAHGLVLHVSLLDGVGDGADELAVLRELGGDAYCLLGTIELAHDECDTSCLEGDGPPFAVSTVHLVSPEHDALRVTTNGGACCSSERGDYSNVALYGVEGDELVEYVSVHTYSAWYTSPWPPIQWTEGEVEVLDATYPARIRVTERTECEPGCAAADAPEEGDAEGEDDDWSVDEECGPDAYTCEPSERTTLYVRRGRRWERAE